VGAKPALGQRSHGRGLACLVACMGGRVAHGRDFGCAVCCVVVFARFQHDGVRGERACTQRCRKPGHDVLVWKVAVEHQDLDQGAGALGVTVGLACRGPPGVVDGSEPS
jgi:hypothetical protein